MSIYEYDNWDGDKGIILAESDEQAKELYKANYNRLIYPDEVNVYDDGVGMINYVCELTTEPQLIITIPA